MHALKSSNAAQDENLTAISDAELRQQFHALKAAGQHLEAAKIAEVIAIRNGDDVSAQMLCSHAYLQADCTELSLPWAERALHLADDDFTLRTHCAAIRLRLGDYPKALEILREALNHKGCPAHFCHFTASVASRAGELDLALELAKRAIDQSPEEPSHQNLLVHLHVQAGQSELALDVIDARLQQAAETPVLLSLKAHICANLGRLDEALELIESALKIIPADLDLLRNKAALLQRSYRFDEAAALIERLCREHPHDHLIRRRAVSLYTQSEELEKAIQAGGEMLALAPDNFEYARCVQQLIERRSEAPSMHELLANTAELKRDAPARRLRLPPTFGQQLKQTGAVMSALILRDIITRHGRNRLGFFWVILEPLVHMFVLAAIFYFTRQETPPLGDSFFLFYFSGIVQFLLLSRCATECGHAILGNRILLMIPSIHPIMILLAKLAVEAFTTAVIVLLFGVIFLVTGALPLQIQTGPLIGAFALTLMLGLGLGALSACVLEFSKIIDTALSVLLRAAYLTAGIFFLPSNLPENLQTIVYWNPLTHLVEFSRNGLFPFYYPDQASVVYPGIFGLVCMTAGLFAVWRMTPTMRTIK